MQSNMFSKLQSVVELHSRLPGVKWFVVIYKKLLFLSTALQLKDFFFSETSIEKK